MGSGNQTSGHLRSGCRVVKKQIFSNENNGGDGEDRVLKNRFDFGVEGDVRGGNSVDREFLTGGFRELEEAAGVIGLLGNGEEALRFRLPLTEARKRHRLTPITAGRTA